MAQESQIERVGTDASRMSAKEGNLNVQAVEDAIADGLSKLSFVKKAVCSHECTEFEVIIVHSSDNNADALVRIVDRMLEIEDQVVKSGDAPDDIYIRRLILQDTDYYPYDDSDAKILFERK